MSIYLYLTTVHIIYSTISLTDDKQSEHNTSFILICKRFFIYNLVTHSLYAVDIICSDKSKFDEKVTLHFMS